jgi:putative ABC transport system permease protein
MTPNSNQHSWTNAVKDLPLAWLQLKRQPIRYLVAITGIGFAALLMFMQIGFQSGLLNSATTFYEALNADLILISPGTVNSGNFRQFPLSLLYRALAIKGVSEAVPIVVTNISAQQLTGRQTTSLRLIGFPPESDALSLTAVREQKGITKAPNFVLFDSLGNKRTKAITEAISRNGSQDVFLSNLGQSFTARGLFQLGSTFAADSNIVSSDSTAYSLAKQQVNPGEISLGLVRTNKTSSIAKVQDELSGLFGNELLVLSKSELIEREKQYWNNASSFGVIFGFGTLMGLLVGGVIVYQVLYTDVNDHLKEYATLKAMGFSNLFILMVVIQEALILGVSSFIPATIISAAMYAFLTAASGIRIEMTTDKIMVVGTLTMAACTISSTIAIRKLRDADPASVF